MQAREFEPGTDVVVGNILRLPTYNRLAMEFYKEGDPLPRFFSRDELSGRRLGAHGVIVGAFTRPGDEGMFVVRHPDGAIASYHCSELVTLAAYAPQHERDRFVPLKRATLRGINFEIYEGIPATGLPCDVLIVPMANGVSAKAWEASALHEAVAASCSGNHKLLLEAAGKFAPEQTVITKAAGATFEKVVFINGIRPTMDMADKTLRVAQADGAKTVVLPWRHFEMYDGLEDDMHYDDLLHLLDVMAEIAGVSYRKFKIAL
jgi:hypothetical protein